MEEKEKKEKTYSEYALNCFENIKKVVPQIHPNCITILTGENATGKSLVRRIIWKQLSDELGEEVKCADTSMQRRTGCHSELGGMGVFLRDDVDIATSINTIRFIKGLLREKRRYLIIDEPEIGMSANLEKSMGVYLRENLPKVLKNNKGILIITHSRIIVNELPDATFVNMQGLTKEEWLTIKPEVIDLEEFLEHHYEMFDLIRDKFVRK